MPCPQLGEPFEVVDRTPLLPACQLGLSDRLSQPVIALLTSGQHQQMRPDRVRLPGLWLGQFQAEFGAEHGAHRQLLGGLGEADDAIQPVMVGDRQGMQPEPLGLDGQFRRTGGPVQEGERGMGMQFGIGHRIGRTLHHRHLVRPPFSRGGSFDHRSSFGGRAQRALQFTPGDRRIIEAHCCP